MEFATEVWRRAASVQPAPSATLVAATALVALIGVAHPLLWRWTRALVTITHEAGHAVVALVVGRRLRGIRLHSDTSGLTVSRGRPSGPGMVAMLLAGYLAPALVGLGAVALLLAGRSLGLLWLFTVLLAMMLLQIRNLYGFALVVGCGGVLVAFSWYATATVQSTLAYLLTWVLLVAAPKPVLELIAQRRRRNDSASDAAQLSRLTRTPASAWIGLFLVANTAGLLAGAALLLPALVALARDLASALAG